MAVAGATAGAGASGAAIRAVWTGAAVEAAGVSGRRAWPGLTGLTTRSVRRFGVVVPSLAGRAIPRAMAAKLEPIRASAAPVPDSIRTGAPPPATHSPAACKAVADRTEKTSIIRDLDIIPAPGG